MNSNDDLVDLRTARRRSLASADRPTPAPANPDYRMSKLQTLDPITLDGKAIPERQWLVRDWIPKGYVTMLNGDGALGKSLLTQMLITAAATGRNWLGLDTIRCRALAIYCEDDADELHRRQVGINAHYDIDFTDLENVQWSPRVGLENALMMFIREDWRHEPTEFFQQVHNAASDFGAQLVVLDSLHDLFDGNENSRPEARRFIQLLTGLARDIDGAVVLNAHPSVAGMASGSGASGSTAWNNSVRSRLYLTKPKDDDGDGDNDARILSRKKSNYSSMGDEIQIRWEDGVFITEGQDAPGGMLGAIEKRNERTAFLECLDIIERQGRTVADGNTSPRYAPRVFAKMPQGRTYGKRKFEAAMHALFDAGEIEVGAVRGADRKLQKCIIRTTN